MTRHATQDEEVREDVDDIGRPEPPIDADRQAFPGELVDHVQHAELPAVVGAVLDKVIGPDVVGMFWPQPHARSVVQPEAPFLRLPPRHFEPFSPPDPLDALDVHGPAGGMQQRCDPPIAVAPILGGELDDVSRQRCFVGSTHRLLSLRRTMLPQDPARQSLRNPELHHDMLDTATTPGGAQKFPRAASARISFSSVRSETAFRRRSFSFSRSFKRFT